MHLPDQHPCAYSHPCADRHVPPRPTATPKPTKTPTPEPTATSRPIGCRTVGTVCETPVVVTPTPTPTLSTVRPPGNLRVTAYTSRSVSLAWDSAPGAVRYRVEKKPKGGRWTGAGLRRPPDTDIDIGSLESCKTHYFRVSASSLSE